MSSSTQRAPVVEDKTPAGLFLSVDATGVNCPRYPVRFNWSGIHPLAPRDQIHRPETTAQLIDLLTLNPKCKVKVIGSGLSYEPIAAIDTQDTTAISIDMSAFDGLESHSGNRFTFGAGSPVNHIIDILAQHELMMPMSPGVIGIQTIAGAISTATHGQGLRQSCLSDMITDLQVILPNASVLHVSSSHPDFTAHICSYGTMGVIRSVTLATVPLRHFQCVKTNCSYDLFNQSFAEWNHSSEFVKAWWYPETDLVHVWRVDEIGSAQADALTHTSTDVVDTTLNYTIDILSKKMSEQTGDPQMVGCHFATINRFRNTTNQTGLLHEIVTKGIPVPQINCEIAVPLTRLADALGALRCWIVANGADALHYPFIFRCTGQSKALMSPSFSGPVCFIGFLVYLSEDGTWYPGSMDLMYSLQVALQGCGGIPHFGKHFNTDIWHVPSIMGAAFDRFNAARRAVDPYGRFLNAFLLRIFSGEKKSTTPMNRHEEFLAPARVLIQAVHRRLSQDSI